MKTNVYSALRPIGEFVQDAAFLGVGHAVVQSARPLPKVETVYAICWRGFAARCYLGSSPQTLRRKPDTCQVLKADGVGQEEGADKHRHLATCSRVDRRLRGQVESERRFWKGCGQNRNYYLPIKPEILRH